MNTFKAAVRWSVLTFVFVATAVTFAGLEPKSTDRIPVAVEDNAQDSSMSKNVRKEVTVSLGATG